MSDSESMSTEQAAGEMTSAGEASIETGATPGESFERETPEQASGGEHAAAVQLRTELDDVEAALDRLDAGTYGSCEVCGAELPDEELERRPQSRVCHAHSD